MVVYDSFKKFIYSVNICLGFLNRFNLVFFLDLEGEFVLEFGAGFFGSNGVEVL